MRPAIITGSIGTGKSTVCAKLAKMGVKIIDADAIAHQILDEKSGEIGEIFGEDCLLNGKVNRKILGDIVFQNRHKRKMLEELVHPIVHDKIMAEWKRCQKNKQDCILDIPLFFESNNSYEGFFIIVVYATREQQFRRLRSRDNLSEISIQKRLDAQWPIEKKCENADWVVDNSKELEALEVQVQKLYKWLKGE